LNRVTTHAKQAKDPFHKWQNFFLEK
jgi:hypothetical protein